MPAELIAQMARHLPPSGSALQLLDLGGHCAGPFSQRRSDLDIHRLAALPPGDARFDAIVALDRALEAGFLAAALRNLRPGGRLIIGWTQGEIDSGQQLQLEAAGFVRVLVETLGGSLLLRGERPHATRDRPAAARDGRADPAARPGRYLHLLLRQTPDRPPWARKPDDPLRWQALTLEVEGERRLPAFSSLPQAVAFMQPALLRGHLQGINKVGKFPLEAATGWPFELLVNPSPAALEQGEPGLFDVDPATAATPDE